MKPSRFAYEEKIQVAKNLYKFIPQKNFKLLTAHMYVMYM